MMRSSDSPEAFVDLNCNPPEVASQRTFYMSYDREMTLRMRYRIPKQEQELTRRVHRRLPGNNSASGDQR